MEKQKMLKKAVIKEELVAITADTTEAILLNQLLYWSVRTKDYKKFIKEEHERLVYLLSPSSNLLNTDEIIEDKKNNENKFIEFGWIYKKATEIRDEIMCTDSEKTINRRMNNLVQKGFLDRRNNLKHKYDRTYQYRVNLINIVQALIEKNYILSEYKANLNAFTEILKILNVHNVFLSEENNNCNEQTLNSISRNDDINAKIDIIKNKFKITMPELIPQKPAEKDLNNSESTDDIKLKVTNIEEKLKGKFTKETFDTWIELLFSNPAIDNNTLILKYPNDFTKDIVEQNYFHVIQEAVKSESDYELKLIL